MKCVEITGDRIIVLIDGHCYAAGTFEELRQSRDERIKEFFE
jgi:phospholipid/cholesterol/gamma-HCH transport system ATP-binding protein